MVRGGVNKDVFLSFLRCTKLAQYTEKFPHLNNEEIIRTFIEVNEIKFKDLAYQLICNAEKLSTSKIFRNKIFKTPAGEEVSADVILKRIHNAELNTKKETILIEIVSSTNLKDGPEFMWLAYKLYLIKKSNYDIDKIYLIKVDSKYEKGKTNPSDFIYVKDVTNKINQFLPNIPPLLKRIKNVLLQNSLMEKQKGIYCLEPNPCFFKTNCWQDMPSENETVFEIEKMPSVTKFQLFWDELFSFQEIPRKRLDKRQWIQVKHGMRNVPLIQEDKIKEWLMNSNSISGTWFLDIGTCYPVEPLCINGRPFSSTPFQFSLIFQFNGGTNYTEYDFIGLNLDSSELVYHFIKNLNTIISKVPEAKIIVYNLNKVVTIMNNLVIMEPELKGDIMSIKNRMVDLMQVFYECWYYLPVFKGSFKLSKIAPLMIRDQFFIEPQIRDGKIAGNIFLNSLYNKDSLSEKEVINLKEYSRYNSMSMIEITKILRQI